MCANLRPGCANLTDRNGQVSRIRGGRPRSYQTRFGSGHVPRKRNSLAARRVDMPYQGCYNPNRQQTTSVEFLWGSLSGGGSTLLFGPFALAWCANFTMRCFEKTSRPSTPRPSEVSVCDYSRTSLLSVAATAPTRSLYGLSICLEGGKVWNPRYESPCIRHLC